MNSQTGLKILLAVCIVALTFVVVLNISLKLDKTESTEGDTTLAAETSESTQASSEDGTQPSSKEETEAPTQKETEPKETEPKETEPVKTEDYITLASLYQTYADKFMIGTIYCDATRQGKGAEILKEHFNVITPENLMKPEYMQPREGTFNFTSSDQMMNFAKEYQVTVIGHTLCWHQQSGNFLGYAGTREAAIEQLRQHIYNVAGQYAGQIYSWDVVNEIIMDGAKLGSDGDWTKCLRKNQWYNSIGPDYVAMAFQFAHEADPNAKLYYNDYNLNDKNKADAAYAMVSALREQGVPIDGIGMQGHYNTDTSIASVKYSLDLFSSIEGIEISVTELDVMVNDAQGQQKLTKEQEIRQAITYAKLFQLYSQYSDVIARVTIWGMADNSSWRSDSFPVLFNADFSPKEAVYAILDPDTYLELHALGYGDNVRTAEAVYGTPKIDGVGEDIWDQAPEYKINTMLTAWNGATGTVKMLWDENYLYVLIHVSDNYLTDRNSNDYEQDSVEVFLDQNLGKTGYFEEDDGHYRVNYKGKISFGSSMNNKALEEGFQAAAMYINSAYTVEMAIPWVVPVQEGTVVGFDAQINDAGYSGNRESIAKFNDPTDNSWSTTERYGELTLKK